MGVSGGELDKNGSPQKKFCETERQVELSGLWRTPVSIFPILIETYDLLDSSANTKCRVSSATSSYRFQNRLTSVSCPIRAPVNTFDFC